MQDILNKLSRWDCSGNYQKIIATLENILLTKQNNKQPRQYSWYLLEAYILMGDLDKSKKLLTYLQKGLRTPSDFAFWYYYYGVHSIAIGIIEDALSFFHQALELAKTLDNQLLLQEKIRGKTALCYYYQGNFNKAKSILDYTIQRLKELDELRERSKHLNYLGLVTRDKGDSKKALEILNKALKDAEKDGHAHILAITLNNIAITYRRQGNLDEALSFFNQVLEIYQKIGSKSSLAGTINNIANIYRDRGDLQKALSLHQRALELRKKVGNRQDIAASFGNIGLIYQSQGKLNEALNCFKQALNYFEELKKPHNVSMALYAIAEVYEGLGEYDQAIGYHRRALSLRKKIGNPLLIVVSLNHLGKIYRVTGKLNEALSLLSEALDLREGVNNDHVVGSTFEQIGTILHIKGRLEEAKQHYYKALELKKKKIDNPQTVAMVLHKIGKVVYEQGDPRRALAIHQKALDLRKKIANPEEIVESLYLIASIQSNLGILDGTAIKKQLLPNSYESPVVKGFLCMINGLISSDNDESLDWWQKALNCSELPFQYQLECNREILGLILNKIYSSKYDNGNIRFALFASHLMAFRNLCESNNLLPALCQSHLLHAKLARLNNEWDEANEWLTKAESIAESIGLSIHLDSIKKEKELLNKAKIEINRNIDEKNVLKMEFKDIAEVMVYIENMYLHIGEI